MTTSYRVTKFDPALRDTDGVYRREDWTSVHDVGRMCDGHVVTMEEYLLIEDAYVLAVDAFMETAGVREVVATGVEIHDGTWMSSNIRLDEGSTLSGDALHETVRACLREKVWCKLEGARGFFVHLGYDLYMFIGLPDGVEPPAALPYLFIEEAESPYLHDEE